MHYRVLATGKRIINGTILGGKKGELSSLLLFNFGSQKKKHNFWVGHGCRNKIDYVQYAHTFAYQCNLNVDH